ncbi:MAG: hypothetical protein ACFFA3_20445 [Promethearchaeota archaeon]
MLLFILDKIVFHGYTSLDTVFIGKNSESFIGILIIALISLLIWFGFGFFSAYWVKRDIKKNHLESSAWVPIIIFTSIIGLIIYLMVRYGETEISDINENFYKFDEIIKEEKESEFNDKIEEISEDEIEDAIEHILEETQ